MKSRLSTRALAMVSARHPWLTLVAWLVIIAGGVVAAGMLKINNEQTLFGTESQHASDTLEEMRGEQPPVETIVVHSDTLTVNDPAFAQFTTGLQDQLAAMPDTVAAVESFFDNGERAFVSADEHTALISARLTGSVPDARNTVEPVLAVVESADADPAFAVGTAGDGSINRATNEVSERDLKAAETIGLPAAFIVLVFVFGALVAAGIPVVLGLLGILLSVGITALISQLVGGVDSLTTNMITMIGLAVGIDYTLFVIERFREERRNGVPKLDAIGIAADTSSRAVLFSGITVIVALTGMLIVPLSIFHALAIGAITAVVSAVLISLTLLPAVLSLLGDRVNWLSLPFRKHRPASDTTNGFWNRLTYAVMRRPVWFAAGSTALLVAMAIPYFTISLGDSSVNDLPDSEAVDTYRTIDHEFAAGRVGPTEIVIEAANVNSPEVQAAVSDLRQRAESSGHFAPGSTFQASADGSIGLLTLFGIGDVLGANAQDAVRNLRAVEVPAAFAGVEAKVSVGGDSAGTVDYIDTMEQYMPIVFAFVLTLSFLILLVVFRSIVLPLKAIVLNLLSVGAAYGMVVLVFQHGFLAGPLGLHQTETIQAFLPVFMFAILFGLSMDYHVFLLSRIQEAWHATGDNQRAVAQGMRSTSGIITGAAAIMVMVFGGFAMGDLVAIQQVGFGLAVAVFLDATIVRTLLVPSSMQLLGKWNWYMPAWLGWLPRISVEGASAHRRLPAPEPALDFSPAAVGGN